MTCRSRTDLESHRRSEMVVGYSVPVTTSAHRDWLSGPMHTPSTQAPKHSGKTGLRYFSRMTIIQGGSPAWTQSVRKTSGNGRTVWRMGTRTFIAGLTQDPLIAPWVIRETLDAGSSVCRHSHPASPQSRGPSPNPKPTCEGPDQNIRPDVRGACRHLRAVHPGGMPDLLLRGWICLRSKAGRFGD